MSIIKFKYIMATGFGIGYTPVIPGTAGSIAALLLYIFIPLHDIFWMIISLFSFIIGVWASPAVEKERGKDPGIVIIDEFVGQWIALLFLPRLVWISIASLVIFRILDIIKPFPASKLEKIEGGTGIMLDDVIAGVYTNILLQLTLLIFFN